MNQVKLFEYPCFLSAWGLDQFGSSTKFRARGASHLCHTFIVAMVAQDWVGTVVQGRRSIDWHRRVVFLLQFCNCNQKRWHHLILSFFCYRMLVSCKRAVTTEAAVFFSRRRHHVEVVTKNMMQIKELLEPLFKRSRLHDVSMVGSAPLNLQCFWFFVWSNFTDLVVSNFDFAIVCLVE